MIARAYDRRHAYELLAAGADEVERETYESALNFGRRALVQLGMSERKALKAAVLFRDHDGALFDRLRPSSGGIDDRYIEATRASRDTFERLLSAEMARIGAEEDEEDETPSARAAS